MVADNSGRKRTLVYVSFAIHAKHGWRRWNFPLAGCLPASPLASPPGPIISCITRGKRRHFAANSSPRGSDFTARNHDLARREFFRREKNSTHLDVSSVTSLPIGERRVSPLRDVPYVENGTKRGSGARATTLSGCDEARFTPVLIARCLGFATFDWPPSRLLEPLQEFGSSQDSFFPHSLVDFSWRLHLSAGGEARKGRGKVELPEINQAWKYYVVPKVSFVLLMDDLLYIAYIYY